MDVNGFRFIVVFLSVFLELPCGVGGLVWFWVTVVTKRKNKQVTLDQPLEITKTLDF